MSNKVMIGHGSGGKLTRKLIKEVFIPHLSNHHLAKEDDAAQLPFGKESLIFTTDAFTVKPMFFPGGDIGKLAVCGTINDLVVSGAIPKYLSATFVIEEGFPIEYLEKLVKSFSLECQKAEVELVAADTKVVENGKADGIFISVSGIGQLYPDIELSAANVRPGDRVVVTGDIGDHGSAILLARGELNIHADISSDCASLDKLIGSVLTQYPKSIRQMRDATRGGVATILNELASQSQHSVMLYEKALPVKGQVQALCEMLGLNPLYLANEGNAILIIDQNNVNDVVETLRQNDLGKNTAIIGEVLSETTERVYLETITRGKRILDSLVEDQLPRIC